jgi:hypothetical protein
MKQYRTFRVGDKLKTVGKDVFSASFIGGMTPQQLLSYQIDVMQWYRDGGKIQDCDRNSQAEWATDDEPAWNWGRWFYRAVPVSEIADEEITDEEITNVDEYTSDVKTKLEYLIDGLEDIGKGVRPKDDLNQANFTLGFVQAVAQALTGEAKEIKKLLFDGGETK